MAAAQAREGEEKEATQPAQAGDDEERPRGLFAFGQGEDLQEDAAQQGAQDEADGEREALEGDGVGQQRAAHQVDGERAPGDLVHGGEDAVDQAQDNDVPPGDEARKDERPGQHGHSEVDQVVGQKDAAPVEGVCHHAAEGAGDELGEGQSGAGELGEEGGVGEAKDQVGGNEHPHPAARLPQEVVDPEAAVVAPGQELDGGHRRGRGTPRLTVGVAPGLGQTRESTYWATQPPSMSSSLPVMNDDSSEARKRTPWATSSGLPSRPKGTRSTR